MCVLFWRTPQELWVLESPRPLKNGVITHNNGVIDPFFKGHGDSRVFPLESLSSHPKQKQPRRFSQHAGGTSSPPGSRPASRPPAVIGMERGVWWKSRASERVFISWNPPKWVSEFNFGFPLNPEKDTHPKNRHPPCALKDRWPGIREPRRKGEWNLTDQLAASHFHGCAGSALAPPEISLSNHHGSEKGF